MKLFYQACGPMMIYRDGTLVISDLNPEVTTRWSMSRGEMFGLAWRCLVAAVRGR